MLLAFSVVTIRLSLITRSYLASNKLANFVCKHETSFHSLLPAIQLRCKFDFRLLLALDKIPQRVEWVGLEAQHSSAAEDLYLPISL